mgnify:CR=1 FL=1
MKNKLLIVGTMAYDSIETPFGKVDMVLGGAGTYIGLAASNFSIDCSLVSIVGSDFNDQHIKLLKNKGIDLSGLELSNHQKTFFWSGKYENDLNKRTTIDTQLNALENFNPIVPNHLRNPDILMLGNLSPGIQIHVIEQLKKKPSLIVLDTMNYWIENFRSDLEKVVSMVDVISINDEEAYQFTGESSLLRASVCIQKLGPKYVIIKKGEHGALLFHSNKIFSAPALPLEKVVDPTGAGDSFAGGFSGFLTQTGDISLEKVKSAVIYGSVLASFAVQKFGTQNLFNISSTSLLNRVNAFKELTTFEL